MLQKSISITEVQEKWLKNKNKKLGISESDIIRRLIDKEIEKESEQNEKIL